MIRCEEFNRYLDDPELRAGAPLPGEAAAHAEECAACRALLDLLRAGPSPAVSYGVERRIRASLARSLERVRPLAPAGAFVAATVAGLGVLAPGAGWLMGPAALRQPSPGRQHRAGSIRGRPGEGRPSRRLEGAFPCEKMSLREENLQ